MKKLTSFFSTKGVCYSTICATFLTVLLSSCQSSIDPIPPQNNKPNSGTGTTFDFTIDSTFTVTETISAVEDKKRMRVAFEGYDAAPVGFYLEAGASVTLRVTKKTGTRYPKLVIGTLSRNYAANDQYWQSNTNILQVQLIEGPNVVTNTTTTGGLLYLRYTSDSNPNSSASVKFLSGMKPVPVFKKDATTNAQWVSMLSTLNNVPDAILIGQRVIVVSSRAKAIEYKNENQLDLLRKLDNVVATEERFMGFDSSSALHAPRLHKALMTEHSHPTLYMYAFWGRTAYLPSGMQSILTTNGIYKDGWGPWHEIGHTYQQTWKWDALGEVTNNIYSLEVQRKHGFPSRLLADNQWAKAAAFLALEDATRDFNSSAASVWVRLCLFQQLYLAFGDSFFIQHHKMYRQENPTLNSDEARMRWFMLNACKVSGKNLGVFFRKWGFKVNETIYTEINALNLPNPTTDLTKIAE